MFARVEGSTCTLPVPRNSGTICGAPLIGPPYIPGGCETPLIFKEAITSDGPVLSLRGEPLTRFRLRLSERPFVGLQSEYPAADLGQRTLLVIPDIAGKIRAEVVCPHSQSICSQENISIALDRADGHAGLMTANIQVTDTRDVRASERNLHPRGAAGRGTIKSNTTGVCITSSIRDKERTFGSR